jgi:phosphoadenosine phosphosulfate reductase
VTTTTPVAIDGHGDLSRLNAHFETAPADEIVRWAVDTFGAGLVATTSMTDAVLVDLVTRVSPAVEFVFLDTGYHFPETLATVETVRRRYALDLRVVSAGLPLDDRWRTDPDGCCAARKVAPLDAVLAERTAWMTGLRRTDSPARAAVPIVARDRRGVVKINPLAGWSDADVDRYIAAHHVPVNPLVFDGFPSIGCQPCTRRVAPGEDARAGRWPGLAKTECGLHLDAGSDDAG